MYGTTLNKNISQQIKKTAKEENQIKVEETIQMVDNTSSRYYNFKRSNFLFLPPYYSEILERFK